MIDRRASALRHGKADGRALSAFDPLLRLFARQAAAGIAGHASLGDALRALLLQLFLPAEAVIRMTSVDQVPCRRTIKLHAFGLEERALVPFNAQPAQAVKDAV